MAREIFKPDIENPKLKPVVCSLCGRVHRRPIMEGVYVIQEAYCDALIPVNIIGGFLGAGKTTFLNYILGQPATERRDILIREYGEAAIDDQLLKNVEGKVHVFPGVSVHDDPQLVLHDYLHGLVSGDVPRPFDRLLLETSGIDTPESLLTLFMLGYMPDHYRLGSLIVIVDAEYGGLDIEEYEVAAEQVAYADIVIINKTDLAGRYTVDALEALVKSINGMAKVERASYAKVSLDGIMDIALYDQLKVLEPNEGAEAMNDIRTYTLVEKRPMDKAKVNAWTDRLFKMEGPKLLRCKGFFNFSGEDYRYEFQAVRKSFHSKADRKWKDGEERKSTVVIIGENLPDEKKLREEFAACAAD